MALLLALFLFFHFDAAWWWYPLAVFVYWFEFDQNVGSINKHISRLQDQVWRLNERFPAE